MLGMMPHGAAHPRGRHGMRKRSSSRVRLPEALALYIASRHDDAFPATGHGARIHPPSSTCARRLHRAPLRARATTPRWRCSASSLRQTHASALLHGVPTCARCCTCRAICDEIVTSSSPRTAGRARGRARDELAAQPARGIRERQLFITQPARRHDRVTATRAGRGGPRARSRRSLKGPRACTDDHPAEGPRKQLMSGELSHLGGIPLPQGER